MTQKPSGRPYRPILRMNDLLHPIQQRERLAEFSTPDEPIGQYARYSRLWAPSFNVGLFVVKVPTASKRLEEEAYRVLMQQRISWLMQRWMQDTQCGQAEVQRLLESELAATSLRLERDAPSYTQDDEAEAEESEAFGATRQWREDWAEVLVRQGDRLIESLTHQGIHFPVPSCDKAHTDFQEFWELHNDTDFETWLTLFTQL